MDQRLRDEELLDLREDETIPYYLYPADYMGILAPQGGCYGGYTHSELMKQEGSSIVIHFNASLWQPYKALLMETEIERQE